MVNVAAFKSSLNFIPTPITITKLLFSCKTEHLAAAVLAVKITTLVAELEALPALPCSLYAAYGMD